MPDTLNHLKNQNQTPYQQYNNNDFFDNNSLSTNKKQHKLHDGFTKMKCQKDQ